MAPKAVLYYSPASAWSRAALITLREKGYGRDELDLRVVDTAKGEEFSPALLRLNPRGEHHLLAPVRRPDRPTATLPTLVVPLQDTLGADVETRFKVIADPKALVDFLDRSRSATSRSNSTSTAPAPSLSPATVGFATVCSKIARIVYSDAVAPDLLSHFNSRDPQSLHALAAKLVPVLKGRDEALATHLSDCEHGVIKMSQKTRAFWNEKKHDIQVLLGQLAGSGADAEEYFAAAKQAWEHAVPDALTAVNKEIIGPYILGDQISIADIHLCVWLVHVVDLSGGHCTDPGDVALMKVEEHTGVVLPRDMRHPGLPGSQLQSRLAVFWDAMRRRPSWVGVFA